jgi:ubiquinone/menaquinone biosynthesis C-methylase UbiE
MYDPASTRAFYDAYGLAEWDRLETSAWGRLWAIVHRDLLGRHLTSGMRVLDAGSGPGRFAIAAIELGARVTVLDMSPQQLDLARDKIAAAGLVDRVDGYVQADVADLAMLPDASFDAAMCFGGALSYVCERRDAAARELQRVLRRGGTLLVSVMSRHGCLVNMVRSPAMAELEEPHPLHVYAVLESGDLPGFPSSTGMMHPAMHLYTSAELCALFSDLEILETAGACVTAFERAQAFEDVASNPRAWDTAVALERKLGASPGLVDTGSHIVMAARKR